MNASASPGAPPGPADPLRPSPATALLPAARRAGARAGVTRLADVTGLDRLGLPVWQAVRPLGRALSVHGGKGATADDARLGALLEAVEGDAAERFDASGPVCRHRALAPAERSRSIHDWSADPSPSDLADRPCRWVEARRLRGGGALFVPYDCVSLDFTRGVPSPFDRASNGVATGATAEEAAAVALHELIERDAVGELRAAGLAACTAATLRLDTVPFGWLAAWRDRLAGERILIRFHRASSLTGTPVFACELNDPGRDPAPYRAIWGAGAHPSPELALWKALAEAVQARATFIAGARDDLPPSAYARRGSTAVAFGLPPPPGRPGVDWRDVAPGPVGVAALADALAAAGYGDAAAVELRAADGFTTVRVLVGGLGSPGRRRRVPGDRRP